MRSGSAPREVDTPRAQVVVNGVERDVDSVSVTRELGGGGVPGVSGLASASGDVTWSQAEDVLAGPGASPWKRTGGFPPAPGTAVSVATGSEYQGVFSALTGVVDSTGADSGGVVSSSLIEPVDILRRRVVIPPLMAVMPSDTSFPGNGFRRVGLYADTIAVMALRACGVGATPLLPPGFVGVSVPLQGSAWPERGTAILARRDTNTEAIPTFRSAPFGYAASDLFATYSPSGTLTKTAGFEIALSVGPSHDGIGIVQANLVAGEFVRLRVGQGSASAETPAGASLFLPLGSAERVTLRVVGTSWTLTVGTASTSGTVSVTGTTVESVRVQVTPFATPGQIGGVMVGNLPAGWYMGQVPNMRLTVAGSLSGAINASPAIDGDVLDVVMDIAKATCRAVWWDEDGVLQWVPGDTLLGRAPVTTLTSTDHLESLGWSESLADTYASVRVDYEVPTTAVSLWPNITVYEGGGSMEAGQVKTETIGPGADEDWIQTDSTLSVLGAGEGGDFNRERGSYGGGVWIWDDGSQHGWATTNGWLTVTMAKVNDRAWLLTHTVPASLPATDAVRLETIDDTQTWSGIWPVHRSKPLPMIRAFGRTKWSNDDYEVVGAGPRGAAQYRHDGGRWVQGATITSVGAFLSTWLTSPRPVARDVSVIHDARVQVGDVVDVVDTHAHGVTLRALITKVRQSVTTDDQEMTLDLYVTSGATNQAPTYTEADAETSTDTYTTLDARLAGVTYDLFEENL